MQVINSLYIFVHPHLPVKYHCTYTWVDISSVRRMIGVPVHRNIRASALVVFWYFSGTVRYAGIVMGGWRIALKNLCHVWIFEIKMLKILRSPAPPNSNFIQLKSILLTSSTIRGSIATYYQPNIAKNLGTGCLIAVHVFLSGRCQWNLPFWYVGYSWLIERPASA